jgi:7-cyano-7-deazaguanine synthase
MVFFTLALAYGAKQGIYDIVTGVCEADDAGYPDCRSEFVESAEASLRLALDEPLVTIWAPLLYRSKAKTWALAEDLGILSVIIEDTHTCYHGDRAHKFEWGYGCGMCGACVERRDGYYHYKDYGVTSAV